MARWLELIVALTLVGSGPAWAQTPPTDTAGQDPPESTLEDVVVSGQTVQERAQTFVDEVAQHPAPGSGALGPARLFRGGQFRG
jgi:hypothetical protein